MKARMYFYYGRRRGDYETGQFSVLEQAIHYLLTFDHVTVMEQFSGKTLFSIGG
jgi:hypothetical protein